MLPPSAGSHRPAEEAVHFVIQRRVFIGVADGLQPRPLQGLYALPADARGLPGRDRPFKKPFHRINRQPVVRHIRRGKGEFPVDARLVNREPLL